MPSWPASLPDFVLTRGYDEAAPDQVLRTEMDAGPAKARRRTTAAPRVFRVTLALTGAQVDALETFVEEDLKGGSLAFDWVHPRSQIAHSFRFTAPHGLRPEAGAKSWLATLSLELLP